MSDLSDLFYNNPFEDRLSNMINQSTGGYGTRLDNTSKGDGFLGPLSNVYGGVSTEISAGLPNTDEGYYPLITPNQSFYNLSNLLMGGKPSNDMYDKAQLYSRMRQLTGRSPFAGFMEQHKYGE